MSPAASVSNLRCPYGMIAVWWFAREAHADQTDDVRESVCEGVKAVRQDADGSGHEAEDDLRYGDGQVQEQNLDEDDDNGVVAAIGHGEPASD